MPPPLVSIAIPVFDTARFLPAALDSLLAQDHAEWEALLWEDGSTDGSAEIAAAYAARDVAVDPDAIITKHWAATERTDDAPLRIGTPGDVPRHRMAPPHWMGG